MRTRHAVIAGLAVTLMSFGTVLMASVSASAHTTAAAPAVSATSAASATASVGSAAGLLLGLITVLALAAVSFILRSGIARRTPSNTIMIHDVAPRAARVFAGAYTD